MDWMIVILAFCFFFWIEWRFKRLERMLALLIGTHPLVSEIDEADLPRLPGKAHYELGYSLGEANVLPGEMSYVYAREVRAAQLKLLQKIAGNATGAELKARIAAHNAAVTKLDEEERTQELKGSVPPA